MSFENLKIGDQVTRLIGGTLAMKMQVTNVSDDLITCAAVDKDSGQLVYGGWTFDVATGAEIDDDLGWTPARTGSILSNV